MGPSGSTFEGKTLDEAVRKGLEALGLSRAEASIQVLEEGSGGFLGFGARPFKIRVTPRPGGAIREAANREDDDRRGRDRGGRGRDRGGRGGRDRGDRGGRGGRDRGGRGGRSDEGRRDDRRQPAMAGGRDDREGRGDRETRGDRGDRAPRAEREGGERGDRGDRGDRGGREMRGDRGERRERGERGERRERGDRGDREPRGERGDRAPRGEREGGDRGDRGERGDRGGRLDRGGRDERPREAAVASGDARRAPAENGRDLAATRPIEAGGEMGGADAREGGDGRRRRRRRGRRGGAGRGPGAGVPGDAAVGMMPMPDDAMPANDMPMEDDLGDDGMDAGAPPVTASMSEPMAGSPGEPMAESMDEPMGEPAGDVEPAAAMESGRGRDRDRGRGRDRDRGRRSDRPERSDRPASDTPMLTGEALEAEARQWTQKLFSAMGFETTLRATADGDRVTVVANLEDGESLIAGDRDEVRQAMQQILNRMINRGEGSRYHLQLEVNDLWEKRETELRALAQRLAAEALEKNGEALTDYLNPQERRLIHVTLREDTRVKTYALGIGHIKRLAVAPADFPGGPIGES